MALEGRVVDQKLDPIGALGAGSMECCGVQCNVFLETLGVHLEAAHGAVVTRKLKNTPWANGKSGYRYGGLATSYTRGHVGVSLGDEVTAVRQPTTASNQ